MWLIKKIKYKYNNASDRVQHELKILLILLCAALIINIPSLINNIKAYSAWELSAAKTDWKISEPGQQAMDESVLQGADRVFGTGQPCSLLIVRHSTIVYEKFYNGMNKDNYNNVYSVTKSFISALTGIAIDKGIIDSSNDKLDRYFPEYCSETGAAFGSISIENLLTMTAGFCEDYNSWIKEKDMVRAVFKLPVEYRPGESFLYVNSASHLLSAIISGAAGSSTFEFAEENLFKPLGIEHKKWGFDGMNINTGYANLYIMPRDMAKFGQLYLNKGKWKGAQIIPEEWVKRSTEIQYKFEDNEKSSTSGYGYNWWITEISGFEAVSAVGYGGQSITVIPGLDIVMVVTSRPDTPVGEIEDPRQRLLEHYIIPAVMDKGE